MTLPEPVFERACSLLTRRVQDRRFLLRPDPPALQAFLYATALAAQETDLDLLGASLLASHKHEVVYDPFGQRTRFLERSNALLARSINVLRARQGRLFQAPSRRDKLTLFGPSDVLRALVYTLTNPVAAGLVDWPHQWPGTVGDWRQILSVSYSAPRPDFFYDPAPPPQGLPLLLTLTPTKPPCFADLSDADYEALVRQAVQERCQALHQARPGPALGRRRALAVSPDHLPAQAPPEPPDTRRFRGDPALVELLLAAHLIWLQAYHKARRARRAGRSQPFPQGTDRYRHHEQVELEPPDPDSIFHFP